MTRVRRVGVPAVAWLTLALLLVLTALVWRVSASGVAREESDAFQVLVDDSNSAIERVMNNYEIALESTVGLFQASSAVEREEFKNFTESLKLSEQFPGFVGIGYAPVLTDESKAAFERKMRKEVFEEFAVYPAGVRDRYVVTEFIEPTAATNNQAIAFDLYSEATRRAAMDAAAVSGQTTVTGPLVLVVDSSSGNTVSSFIMYSPFYRTGAATSTPDERREALVGWVFAPFRAKALMDGILAEVPHAGRTQVYFGVSQDPGSLLYDSEGAQAAHVSYPLSTATQLPIAGQTWTTVISGESPLNAVTRAQPWIVAGVGLVIDCLIFVIIISLANRRDRAEQLAVAMTNDLRVSEERSRKLFESTPMPLIVVDNGRVVDVNQAAESKFGSDGSNILHRSATDLVSLADAASSQRSQQSGRGEATFSDVGLRDSEGHEFTADVSSRPFELASPTASILAITDVSARAQAAAAGEALAEFVKLTASGVITIDEYGTIEEFNPGAEHLFGYSASEVLGRNFKLLMTDQYLPEHDVNARRYLETGDVPVLGIASRVEAKRKDGSVFPVSITVTEVYSGGRRRFTGMVVDITELVAGQTELNRLADIVEASPDLICVFDAEGVVGHVNRAWRQFLNLTAQDTSPRELAGLLGRDTAERIESVGIPQAMANGSWSQEVTLSAPRQTLEAELTLLAHSAGGSSDSRFLSLVVHDIGGFKEVERVKNEFISTVSHELRTPLTSIRGSLGLLAGGAMGVMPEKAQTMLQVASQNTDRLIRLINDILDLEKIQAGGLELQLAAHDIATVLSDSVEGVRGMADANSVSVVMTNVFRPAIAIVDRDRMVQVFTNLLSNAIKFSPAGTQVTVGLSAPTADGFFEAKVADQGPGIPADKLTSIFNRFAQVDSTSTRAKGGTGLGLAIVKDIVILHGGSVHVTSEPGAGSTFLVRVAASTR